jgi:protein SCO1/2
MLRFTLSKLGIAFANFIVCVFFSLSLVMAETKGEATSNSTNTSNQDDGNVNQVQLMPVTPLVRQDGIKVMYPQEVDDGKPVVLTFIFTTCKAVCPVMSHIMKSLQDKFGERAKAIHMTSISLDPEYDTPERLTQYAHQLGAGPQWMHYTGLNTDIVKLEKALGVYRGDKMNHIPAFFVRRTPGEPWVKLVGFVSTASIINALGIDSQVTSETVLSK